MAAGIRDLALEQGATFRFHVQWLQPAEPKVPYDITGGKARLQVRSGEGELLIDLTAGKGITLDEPNGIVKVVFAAAETWKLTMKRAKYDLVLQLPGGDVARLLKGRITIDPAVTDYRDALVITPAGEPALVSTVVAEPEPAFEVTS